MRRNLRTRSVQRAVADGTRFADFTRPITRDKQLVKGSYRLLIGVGAIIVFAALLAALFVLPLKSWFRQRDDLTERRRELAVLDAANAQLTAEVNYLQTPDGILEAARAEIGYGNLGERRLTVMPAPDAPVALPAGWPYDGVTQIVAVRTAAATPATTAPPATATVPTESTVDPRSARGSAISTLLPSPLWAQSRSLTNVSPAAPV